jgi:uncharacterized membrane-anchored protein YitT (DUF2179 family)
MAIVIDAIIKAEFVTVDIIITILTWTLFLLGLLIFGKAFAAKTLVSAIVYPIGITLFLKLTDPNVLGGVFCLRESGYSELPLVIAATVGGALVGVGCAVTFFSGGSTGGTDIIALVWCKFKPASPGRVILIIDIMIILSSLLLPSYDRTGALLPYPEKVAIVVYGLMQVTVCGYAIDLYISGSKQSVQAFIFTKKVNEMADAIAFDMKRGVTVLPAKGWYSKEDKQVIMVVTRKTDLNLLLRYVKSIDPDAFLSVSSVMGVYGQGFDAIKVRSKK